MKLFHKNLYRPKIIFFFLLYLSLSACSAQPTSSQASIVTGAEQLDLYLPKLKDKKVALIVNQTSMVGNTHLVDTLLAHGVQIAKVFAPEHGFRGEADAG